MVTIKIIIAIGERFIKNSLNDSFAALPINIFGGSPINVAVPPILEAITSEIKNGIESISSCSAIRIVTGPNNKIVVTLSNNAENIAVINH